MTSKEALPFIRAIFLADLGLNAAALSALEHVMTVLDMNPNYSTDVPTPEFLPQIMSVLYDET